MNYLYSTLMNKPEEKKSTGPAQNKPASEDSFMTADQQEVRERKIYALFRNDDSIVGFPQNEQEGIAFVISSSILENFLIQQKASQQPNLTDLRLDSAIERAQYVFRNAPAVKGDRFFHIQFMSTDHLSENESDDKEEIRTDQASREQTEDDFYEKKKDKTINAKRNSTTYTSKGENRRTQGRHPSSVSDQVDLQLTDEEEI